MKLYRQCLERSNNGGPYGDNSSSSRSAKDLSSATVETPAQALPSAGTCASLKGTCGIHLHGLVTIDSRLPARNTAAGEYSPLTAWQGASPAMQDPQRTSEEGKGMNLGFIGLGHLGKAIAGRLLDCGHALTVWNRTPSKAADMRVELASSPKSVMQKAECTFLCMFDSTAVRSVLTQKDGLLSGDISGRIVVDLSTNHFREVSTFHGFCQDAHAFYLEAPVLGSVVPASQGALTVLISGDSAAYQRVKPVLDCIGKHLFYLGEPGLATKMKLINNLALGSIMATLAEALAFGEEVGIAKGDVLEILSLGAGNSLVLNAKKNKLLEEDFSTHFSNALIYKDLHCLQELAYERKRPLFTGAVIKELYGRTFGEGIEQEDFSAIYKLFRRT